MAARWDPLQPDPDLTEAHRPLDGSDGVTIGDDSDTAPQPVYRPRGRLPWWVLYVALALAALAVIVAMLAPAVGGEAPPADRPAQCAGAATDSPRARRRQPGESTPRG